MDELTAIEPITDLNDYQSKALVTLAVKDDLFMNRLHAAVGLATETGEVFDAIKRAIWYNKDIMSIDLSKLDSVNMMEEIGDCLWYIAIGIWYLKSHDEPVPMSTFIGLDTFKEAADMAILTEVTGIAIGRGPDQVKFIVPKEAFRTAAFLVESTWDEDLPATGAHLQKAFLIVVKLAEVYGIDIVEAATKNIAKLKKRYESKGGVFSDAAAKNRNLLEERLVLETH